MLLLLSQQAFILIFRRRWCSNHTSEVVTFHPELSKAPPQRKSMYKKKGVMIKWSVKSCKISVGEKGNVKDIPQDISARTGSCHTFPQCSLCCEPLGAWCISMVSGGRAVLCLVCAQNTALPEPPLHSDAFCWTDWAFYLYLNLCHKLLNLVIINKQKSKEKKTTKCFRVTDSIVIIENTTTAMKGAHIKYPTVKNANNQM